MSKKEDQETAKYNLKNTQSAKLMGTVLARSSPVSRIVSGMQ